MFCEAGVDVDFYRLVRVGLSCRVLISVKEWLLFCVEVVVYLCFVCFFVCVRVLA